MRSLEGKLRVFWSRVNKHGPIYKYLGRCWLWTGPAHNSGYGKAGTLGLTHRFSYEYHYGEIPAGLSVLHHCDRILCIRPEHLFLGTQQDNLQDMRDKGHQVRGEGQGSAKLTEEQVEVIRPRYKRYSHTDGTGALADEFGVSPVAIWRVVKDRTWRHI